jgi:integrase
MRSATVLEMPVAAKEKLPKRRERGSGRVYWRGESPQGCYWIAYYVRGRKVQESARTKKKMVAEEVLRRRLVEVEDGAVAPQRVSYEQMRDALYKDYETRGHKSLLTHKDGTRYIGTVPSLDAFFAGCRGEKVTTDKLKDFIRARQTAGISNSGINGSLRTLRRMFWLQVQENRYPRNLVPHFPMLPKDKPRTDFFMPKEYEAALKEMPDDLKPLLTVGYYTGARKSELLKRRWTDVDLEAKTIIFRNTKNGEDRIVPLIPEALAPLKALREAHPKVELVFVRANGEPIRDFRRAWKNALERAKLKGKLFHGLRRGVTTGLAEAGVPEQIAMAFTGHKDIATHRNYRQLLQNSLRDAAVALGTQLGKNGYSLGTAKKPRKSKVRK